MFDITQEAPKYLNLVVTHECDQHCAFCVDRYVHSPERMTTETVQRALVFAKEHQVSDVLIIGGEPTAHPDIVEIARAVKGAGFRAIMTTNFSHPPVVRQLDGIVDCFNISFYNQPDLPLQRWYKSDLTLHALIHSKQLQTHERLDRFIDQHRDNGHLKFSTLTPCNKWAARHQLVPYLDELQCKWVVLFNEMLGQVYRDTLIKRYDRVISQMAEQSWKAHVDGEISRSWERTRLTHLSAYLR